ncbi:MAG: DUF998 domain-containing protein [Paracoccaceae bacterium]
MLIIISAVLSAACYAVVLGVFLAFHVIAPERSIFAHAVSDYAVGKTARLFIGYGLVGSLGAALLAIATVSTGDFPVRVPIYLALLAILRIGVLRFRTDIEGEAVTREGRLHYVFAIITFALTYMIVSAAQPTLGTFANPPLNAILSGLGWIATISLVGVVTTLLPPLTRVFGLAERIFLLSTAFWLLLLAVTLVASR